MAESMSTPLTTWADKVVYDRKDQDERMNVRSVSENKFQVWGGGVKEGLVDISRRTCSCRVFQLDQLVCAHAIAACLHARVDYIGLCSQFYSKESLLQEYAVPINPVGDVCSWEVPHHIQQLKVNPPIEKPPPGRRKELRIPSVGEDVSRRTVMCSRCKERGHNRKRCKNPIATNPN